MHIDFLLEVFRENAGENAIVWQDREYSYQWLLDQIDEWRGIIKDEEIQPGAVTVLEADFSPNSVALFLALLEHNCILVPLTESVEANKPEFIEIAQGEVLISIDDEDQQSIRQLEYTPDHEILLDLKDRGHPGLILFSSGSTGKSKAAVHDMLGILEVQG